MGHGKIDSARANPAISWAIFCILLSGLGSVWPHCVHMPATSDFRSPSGLLWCDVPGPPGWCPGLLFGTAASGSSPFSFARYLSASRLNFLRFFPYLAAFEEEWFQLSRILARRSRFFSHFSASLPLQLDCLPGWDIRHLSGSARRARERLDRDVDQPPQAPQLGAQLHRFGFWRCRGITLPAYRPASQTQSKIWQNC